MTETEKARQLEALLRRCSEDHHRAFAAEDGADAEWPMWYAAQLQQPVNELLERNLTQSALIYWLIRVEKTRRREAPDAEWPAFYAADLLASGEELEV
jgi:hypothetical protein